MKNLSLDFTEKNLNEVYTISSGLSKSSDEFGFGYPFLSFKTIFHNYYIVDELDELVNSTEEEQKKYSVKKGDVFLTRTSETLDELGMSCVALKDYSNTTFNGFTKRLRPKNDNIIHPLYACYYFRSPIFRKYIDSMAIMTTRASLNNNILSKLPIIFPNYETQKKIGILLYTLDKKISLNRKLNKNLEHQLSLIFNEWFIKCTPFNKEHLIKTEWGNVPKYWKDINFGELIEITSGDRPKEKSEDKTLKFNIPLFGASKIMGYTKEVLYDEDILIIGRVGTHGVVQRVNYPCFPSDNTFVIKSKYYGFVYQLLKRIDYDSLNTGSTQPLITQKSLKNLNVILPDENILSKFEMLSKVIFDRIYLNNNEIVNLIKLRDTLLPKLMSGEIDVSKLNTDLE